MVIYVRTYPTSVPLGGVVGKGSSRQSAGQYRLDPTPEAARWGSIQEPPVPGNPRDIAVPCSCRGHPERGRSGPVWPFEGSPIGESASSGPGIGDPRVRASRRGNEEVARSAIEAGDTFQRRGRSVRSEEDRAESLSATAPSKGAQ